MPERQKLSSLSELLTGSGKIYLKHWPLLIVTSTVTVTLWHIWQNIILKTLLHTTGIKTFVEAIKLENINQSLGYIVSFLAMTIASMYIVFFIGFLGTAVIIIILSKHTNEKHVSLVSIMKSLDKLFFPLFLVSLMVFAIETTGFILFLIPGLFLAFFLQFCSFVTILENKVGSSVLTRSIYLVKNNFWGIFGRYLVISMVSLIPYLLFSKSQVFLSISQSIAYPFIAAYHYLLYKDAI